MLVLTRKKGERIQIGDNVFVTVIQVGNTVRLGIDAPKDVKIVRTELSSVNEKNNV